MLRTGVSKVLQRGGVGVTSASNVGRVGIIRGFTPGDARKEGEGSALLADRGKLGTSVFHKLNLTLLGVAPLAVATSPSILSSVLDFGMGLALPLHAHVGLNIVITDYVPPVLRKGARVVVLGATIVAATGLTVLNIRGPGITGTLKGLWSPTSRTKASQSASDNA